jgi:hypothetical protein
MEYLRDLFPTAQFQVDPTLEAAEVRDVVRISETGEVLPTPDYCNRELDEYRLTGLWSHQRRPHS